MKQRLSFDDKWLIQFILKEVLNSVEEYTPGSFATSESLLICFTPSEVEQMRKIVCKQL